MKKALQAYCTILIVFCFSLTLNAIANDRVDFSQMDDEINLQPWLSYQKLLSMESTVKSYDESQKLWWLVRKAQAENLIYFYDDFKKTVKQANNAVSNLTSLNILTRLSLFQGLIHRQQGEFSLSEVAFNKALTQAKKAKISHLYIYSKQELAYTKTLIGSFETALIDIQAAYVEAFALKDAFLVASINETYGAIYGYLNDYEKSIDYYQRALEAYTNLKYPSHIAEAVYGLATTYRYWKKFDLAIEYFQQYKQKMADNSNNSNTKISFFSAYGLGMTYAEKGDCEQAVATIDQALALNGLIDYNAELYKRKASCLIALKRLNEAEEALLSAKGEFLKMPEITETVWQLGVIKISGELAYARGNYKLGYKMLAQYYQKYTELLTKNSSNRLLRVRTSLEVERKKISQALEKKQSQVELLELEKRKNIDAQQVYFNIFIVFLVLATLTIVAVQYRNNKKMRALTIRDPLSHLFNRRYVFEYLNKLITGRNAKKVEFSIILLDIDDFKKINDRYGHPTGDDVICNIAAIGEQVFRQEDIFGRIGGEEYMCVLPRTNIIEAEKVAKRLLTIVNKSKIIKGQQDKVTVSIGVAAWSATYNDVNQLYANVDQALYQAKRLGKNQVNVF